MPALGDVFFRIGADMSGFNKGISTVETRLGGLKKTMLGLGAALGIGAAGYALKRTVSGYLQYADTLQKMSLRTGVAVESLAKLKYAAEQSGSSIENVEAGIKFFQKNLGEFAQENTKGVSSYQDNIEKLQRSTAEKIEALQDRFKKATISNSGNMQESIREYQKGLAKIQRDAAEKTQGYQEKLKETGEITESFKQLGFTLKDFEGLSPEKSFMKFALRLADVKDQSMKVNIAQAVLNKSATTLIPLLNEGSAGIAKLAAEAEKAGLVISTKAANAAVVLGDNIDRLTKTISGMGYTISKKLVEPLTRMVDRFQAWADLKGDAYAQKIADGLMKVANAAADAVVWIGENGSMVKGLAIALGSLYAMEKVLKSIVLLSSAAGAVGLGGAAAKGAALAVPTFIGLLTTKIGLVATALGAGVVTALTAGVVLVGTAIGVAAAEAFKRWMPDWMPGSDKWNKKKWDEVQKTDADFDLRGSVIKDIAKRKGISEAEAAAQYDAAEAKRKARVAAGELVPTDPRAAGMAGEAARRAAVQPFPSQIAGKRPPTWQEKLDADNAAWLADVRSGTMRTKTREGMFIQTVNINTALAPDKKFLEQWADEKAKSVAGGGL